MLDCREVAKYFIIRAYQDGRDTDMTNMKVQKLLYYAQSLHLTLFDEMLFDEEIQAWRLALKKVQGDYPYTEFPTTIPFSTERLTLLNQNFWQS